MDVQKMMSARDAHKAILELGRIIPRRESVSASHDIVWECRMCQSDETCFFCHSCWEEEGHVGHDVTFYHAHAGGCCDCGDADG